MTRATLALVATLTLPGCYTTAQGLGASGAVDALNGHPVAGYSSYQPAPPDTVYLNINGTRIRCRVRYGNQLNCN